MPQMDPLPWVFLLLGVFCLVIGVLMLIYFTNMIYLTKKSQIINKNHLWAW